LALESEDFQVRVAAQTQPDLRVQIRQSKPAEVTNKRSINITQEALRIGKLPTEEIAFNIARGSYNKKAKQTSLPISPRVAEMIELTEAIKKAFKETNEAPKTQPEFYRAGKMLGRGAFGKVNLGMHKITRKLIAIKSINKEYLSEEKQRSKIMHEVGILLQLRHQSVVKLYETFETKRHIMLVMELCAGGDLLNFVRKRKRLDEETAKILFKQVIEGIGYIHSKKILHRDIKLDNILLDGKGNVKIADFGVSKQVKAGEVMYEQSGTPAYIAPEIIKDKGYKGFKADLWSAGVVLFAMLYGTVPFKANNMKDLHKQIIEARYNLKDEITSEAKDLIKSLLNPDPNTRYTI
jgi:serine/threonine protein kinase